MEGPPSGEGFRQCSRRGSPHWRCKEAALPGKSLCQRHQVQNLERRRNKAKRKDRDVSFSEISLLHSRRRRRQQAKLEEEEEEEEEAASSAAAAAVSGFSGDRKRSSAVVAQEIARIFGECEAHAAAAAEEEEQGNWINIQNNNAGSGSGGANLQQQPLMRIDEGKEVGDGYPNLRIGKFQKLLLEGKMVEDDDDDDLSGW